ncbi:LTA synthase family protein [Clostridium rectalis]|uniref:LTA synthase family protein n=1 Tax=Clostridium rectalis TaxID=2040295 RepID=UPI000F63ED69|nr:LTA synthase family protein [Clostridium rectalis]
METFKNTNFKTKYSKFDKILNNLYLSYKNIKENKLFKYSFIIILIKTLLFVLLISSDKAVSINANTVLHSVPPILVYISFICLIFSFSFLFNGIPQLCYFILTNIILTIIYIGDIWYYRSNHSFLSYHLLKATSNLNNLGDSIFAMSRSIDILFLLDIIFIIFISLKDLKMYKRCKRNLTSFFILFLLPILYLVYAHYKVDILKKGYENQILFKGSWTQNQTMASLTPIGYHIFDIYTFYKESQPYIIDDNEKIQIDNWFKSKSVTLPDNRYKGIFKDKNLIILQVESLENFVVGQKIQNQEITPNLNKLLKNSLYFDNYIEQTHNGTTSDAELLTNTSIYPVRSGSTFFRYPGNTYVNSLPNIMKRLGYNTVACHPDKGSYWNWLPALKSIGFDKCYDSSSFNSDEVIGLGISDKSFLNQLPDILEKEKQPFYSFSITVTSHSPFNLPKEYEELKLNSSFNESRMGKYFQSIHYTDKQIGNFLNILKKKNLLNNSVVVLYGDHEGVHKFFDDEINSMSQKEKWWDNNLEIPLIIYSKDIKGETISTTGGQVDLLPTLSYLMGANSSDYLLSSIGRNLLNTKLDFAVTSTGKYIGKETKKLNKEFFLKGITISDKIIRANYFKK